MYFLPTISSSLIQLYSSAILGYITWFFKHLLGRPDTITRGLMFHVSLKARGIVSYHS